MRTMVLVSLLAMMAFATTASANLIVNGGFDTGDETGWTRWNSPWGGGQVWEVLDCDCEQGTCPEPCDDLQGRLRLPPNATRSFGWFQRIAVQASTTYTLSGCWCGELLDHGWAEVMMFTCTEGMSDSDIASRLDTGNAADIVAKKDTWGLNPPNPWDCDNLADSAMNPFDIHATCNEIVIGMKLGSDTGKAQDRWVCFDHLSLVPEPTTALLLGLPLVLLRRRR